MNKKEGQFIESKTTVQCLFCKTKIERMHEQVESKWDKWKKAFKHNHRECTAKNVK